MKNPRINIIALIGARGGSKGIKNKNIQAVGGYPLIAYPITCAQLVPEIPEEAVYFSTESGQIRTIAGKFMAETGLIKRPAKYSSDKATDIGWLSHAIETVEKSGKTVDLIVHLRATTPFIVPFVIDDAIKLFLKNKADSLRSVHPLPESPYKMYEKRDNYLHSYMGTPIEETTKPRQSMDIAWVPNGYVDILRASVIKAGSLYGEKILAFETEPVIEVDSQHDLDLLRATHEDAVMFDYLRSFFPGN